MLEHEQHRPQQHKQKQKQKEQQQRPQPQQQEEDCCHEGKLTAATARVGGISYAGDLWFGRSKSQRFGQDFVLRPPTMGEDRRRLLVAVTNDPNGNAFLNSLRTDESQQQLGFTFAGTLVELLERSGVRNAGLARELRDSFAFLEILPGYDFPVMNGVLRHGCGVAPRGSPMAQVDIESDFPMRFSRQTSLGPNYNLRSNNSKHDQYLSLLTVPTNRSANGIKIAVVDSGFEKPGVVSDFLDLVESANKSEKDTFGHGTAMASIIADVAQNAVVSSVRASDQGPHVSEAMLGICAASFHFQADIVNLSFGLPQGQSCPSCGSQSAVSKVFYRLLRSLSEKPMSAKGPPILVAATGNDGVATGFDAPALWNFTLAVGSINANKDRSIFSNYGTTGHAQYIMMPGGEETQGAATEWIGEATQKCYGTSAAAAYASGVLALYMANPSFHNQDRAKFLADVLNHGCTDCNNQNPTEHGQGYLPYK